MKISIHNYSKFIYQKIEAPPKAPSGAVETRLKERQRKKERLLKQKMEQKEIAQKYAGKKDELLNYWIENNPDGKKKGVEDDPKYLALREIPGTKVPKEAFVLLGIIERFFGGKEAALDMFKKCKKGTAFNIEKLRKFFTKDRTRGDLGFYYGTRIITWDYDVWTTRGRMAKRIKAAGFKSKHGSDKKKGYFMNVKHVYVKGWWAHDIDEEKMNKNYIKVRGGYYVKKDLLRKLRDPGYGDEWLGKDIFEAMRYVPRELYGEKITPKEPGARDSGLEPDEEEKVLVLIKKLSKEQYVYKKKAKEQLYDWFKNQPRDKWISLPEDKVGLMNYLYGASCGKYLYRFSLKKKKIYAVKIQGERICEGCEPGGYIDIKKNVLGNTWFQLKPDDTKKLFKAEILAEMTPKQIESESSRYRVEATKEPGAEDKETLTKGVVAIVQKKMPTTVKYSDIQSGYFDKLRTKLKEYFEKTKKYKSEKASELADYRKEKLNQAIKDYIKLDKKLEETLAENPEAKIRITVDSNDKPSIALIGKKERDLYNKLKEKGKAAFVSTKELIDDVYGDIKKKIGNPIIAWIVDKFFNLRQKLEDMMIKGKKSKTFGLVASFLGFGGVIAASKLKLGSRKMNQETFENLIEKNRKSHVAKDKMYFASEVILNKPQNKIKIVIPKGKGIKPGGKMKELKEMAKVEPEKEKKGGFKGFFGGLFGGKGGEKGGFEHTDKEIIITEKIPAGTIIPKGAKIIRA